MGLTTEYYERHLSMEGYYLDCDCYWCRSKHEDANKKHEEMCLRKTSTHCHFHNLEWCHCDCSRIRSGASR